MRRVGALRGGCLRCDPAGVMSHATYWCSGAARGWYSGSTKHTRATRLAMERSNATEARLTDSPMSMSEAMATSVRSEG